MNYEEKNFNNIACTLYVGWIVAATAMAAGTTETLSKNGATLTVTNVIEEKS